jgi:DNA-binding Lrp family transcriptional regulator
MSLTELEKTLLTLLGEDSSLSLSQLQEKLQYKRINTVSKKIKDLRRAGYMRGPVYHINLNAVGKNSTHTVLAEIRFDPKQYSDVFTLITSIDCWEWIFPTMQGDTIFVVYQSNYYTYLTRLLALLKNAELIEYQVCSSQNRWFEQNPHFFGAIYPSVTNVFEDVTIDLQYPRRTHDVEWRFIDLKMMQYLKVRTCSVSEIQKMEKREYGRFWRRSQIKYSIKKIIDAGVAERIHYNISPYPRGECYSFLLLIEGDTTDVLPFIVNFAQGCRIYKAYTMCKNMGFVWCWANPQVGLELMSTLEELYPRIHARCLQMKSIHHALKKSFNDEHFDFETQRWTFPFTEYKEQIETILEKRKR